MSQERKQIEGIVVVSENSEELLNQRQLMVASQGRLESGQHQP